MVSSFLTFLSIIGASLAASHRYSIYAANECSPEECLLPDCKCSSTDLPRNLTITQVPQFVLLTFDDAVRADLFENYKTAIFGKTNPDGCPIGSTYFISHEYTDYSKVNELYNNGQEIALHSITHETITTYWKDISKDELKKEFGGEKDLISHFANVPSEAIKGMRMPFLQLSDNNNFEVGKEIGLDYDCSWPSQNIISPVIWPYTLDYLSTQDCPIGPCPTESIPGYWVIPMIDWIDTNGTLCSMVDACQEIPQEEQQLFQWILSNFNRHYEGNRAPFGFYLHAAWFLADPIRFEVYLKFIDYLQSLQDVYIVNIENLIRWLRNPVPLGSEDWPECPIIEPTDCKKIVCELYKNDVEARYMTVCSGSCPNNYPWLDNPLGV